MANLGSFIAGITLTLFLLQLFGAVSVDIYLADSDDEDDKGDDDKPKKEDGNADAA